MEIKKLLLFVVILRLAVLIKGQLDLPPPSAAPPTPSNLPQPQQPSPPEHSQQQPQPLPPRGHDFHNPRLPFPYAFPAAFSNPFTGNPHNFLQGQPSLNLTGHSGFATPDIAFGPPANFGPREPFVPYRNPNYIFPTRPVAGNSDASHEHVQTSTDAKSPGTETVPVNGNEYHQGFSHTQETPNDQSGGRFQGYHPQFNYESFRPDHFGAFDYNFAPPQQVSQNIQVDGQQFGNDVAPGRGDVLQTGPVAGFYGPPPNIRHYSIPSLGVQGYQYDSRDDARHQQQDKPLVKVEPQVVKA